MLTFYSVRGHPHNWFKNDNKTVIKISYSWLKPLSAKRATIKLYQTANNTHEPLGFLI